MFGISDKCRLTEFDLEGGIWFYVIGSFYLFLGLIIICEKKFKEVILESKNVMNLSEDVAGATLVKKIFFFFFFFLNF